MNFKKIYNLKFQILFEIFNYAIITIKNIIIINKLILIHLLLNFKKKFFFI